MNVLAAVADGPTAAIAVVALVFGLFVVARGRRGERVEDGSGASLLSAPILPAPVAAPADATGAEEEPDGLQTMAVGEIGHGAIRLGVTPRSQPAPEPAVEPEVPGPQPAPAAAEPPDPEPPPGPPTTWTPQPAPPPPPPHPAP